MCRSRQCRKQRGIPFLISEYNLQCQRRDAICAVARAQRHTRCFESNRGANKKGDRRPEPGTDLFTEHPAFAIYFIDCHLP